LSCEVFFFFWTSVSIEANLRPLVFDNLLMRAREIGLR
jgi:hypothetical protein